MNKQLSRIESKLARLKQKDKHYQIFGAADHRYQFNEAITPSFISKFESDHQCKLPEEYLGFLEHFGNGGAGPGFGLTPIEDCLICDRDYKVWLSDPSKPFQHTSKWDLDFRPSFDPQENLEEYRKEYKEFETNYHQPKYLNGAISICNDGCGYFFVLVVNGPEYGNIWMDGRVSDGGIYPSTDLGNTGSIKFLDWYELWLDNSLNKITQTKTIQNKP